MPEVHGEHKQKIGPVFDAFMRLTQSGNPGGKQRCRQYLKFLPVHGLQDLAQLLWGPKRISRKMNSTVDIRAPRHAAPFTGSAADPQLIHGSASPTGS